MPRTKTSSSFQNMINREKKIILQVRNWLILIVVVLLIGLGIYLISHLGSVRTPILSYGPAPACSLSTRTAAQPIMRPSSLKFSLRESAAATVPP